MGNILPFKRQTPWQKHKGSSLCRDGFHRWQLESERKFDVQQGKLVTEYCCQRCGKKKIKLL